MKRVLAGLAAFLLFVSVASAAYTYFLTENLYTPNWSNWNVYGTMTPTWFASGGYGGITGNSNNGGYMIDNNTNVFGGEVRMTIRYDGSGGVFSSYLLAILDSQSGNEDYYQIQINVGGSNYGGNSTVGLYKAWTAPNDYGQEVWQTAFLGWSNSFSAEDGMVMRSVVRTDAAGGYDIIVYINNVLVDWYHDTGTGGPTYGGMGVGVTGNTITGGTLMSEADLGQLDTTAPNAIPSSSIGVSAYTNHVDLQWPAGTDNTNGIGVYGYQVLRNGQVLTTTTGLSYSDTTVVPSTSYTYTLNVIDYHWNIASTTFTVDTPNVPTNPPYPSVTPDGRRVGVRQPARIWAVETKTST